jgi:transglutaminase-like putative cysteine protease
VPISCYVDIFGNTASRLVAPAGIFSIDSDAVVRDNGALDVQDINARQTPVDGIPIDAIVFLMGSRYCETDRLADIAWYHFGGTQPGWERVVAICNFVHAHVQFGYAYARKTRTAMETYNEGKGVCRDFAHLAIAFCRCMNIPARYCTGYLSDIGVAQTELSMDFAAWFEAYLDGQWYTFDPRNNAPRIGRVLMARGRDACDTALVSTFGFAKLVHFQVWTTALSTAAHDPSPGYA